MSKRKYDHTKVLQKHLHKSREFLDKLKDSPARITLGKQLKELQKALDAQRALILENDAAIRNYSIAMLDLCKHREINVSAAHKKLKTAPWTMGKEKYDEEQAEIRKKNDKKNKKKKH